MSSQELLAKFWKNVVMPPFDIVGLTRLKPPVRFAAASAFAYLALFIVKPESLYDGNDSERPWTVLSTSAEAVPMPAWLASIFFGLFVFLFI
jgi:disulfide bond formation protein DsbB